jgi:hypothetical protein
VGWVGWVGWFEVVKKNMCERTHRSFARDDGRFWRPEGKKATEKDKKVTVCEHTLIQ